jgi:hypothetical protein
MFRLIWAASVRTHAILNYAPTNILIAATRTRRGLRWGIPAMLLAIPYFLASHWCVTAIEAGGPGWLNLLVLLCGWNSINRGPADPRPHPRDRRLAPCSPGRVRRPATVGRS